MGLCIEIWRVMVMGVLAGEGRDGGGGRRLEGLGLCLGVRSEWRIFGRWDVAKTTLGCGVWILGAG